MPVEQKKPAIPISAAPSLQAEALLAELEDWRDLIARHLVDKFHAITEPDLNRIILLTVLRVLFLKTCEERGLGEQGTLQRLSAADHIHDQLRSMACGGGVGPLTGIFREDDSGRPPLTIDDETLRTILGRTGSFEFPSPLSAIPPAELAVVFEQYLGSKIRIAEGYRARRDARSAVRDAGGIHISPQPVVGHMVKETIQKLVEGKTPREVSGVHVLDPACGAGIFLLALYRHLLDWHLGWYRNNLVSVLAGREMLTGARIHMLASGLPVSETGRMPEEPDLPLRYSSDGDPMNPESWTLSPPERGRILATSIAGTDTDPGSVEVARFLLLLASLDDYPEPTGNCTDISGLCRTAERLRGTIRCGNSLIAPDYFTHRQEHPFNVDERRRVNAFDWQAAYPEICAGGGFDAVIGAPPSHRPSFVKSRDEYFQMHYAVYAKTCGLYGYFIERGLSLVRDGSALSFIVPDAFLRVHHARPLRRLLLNHQIEEIADIGECRVLQAATMRTCILRITKQEPDHAFLVSRAEHHAHTTDECTIARRFSVDQKSLGDGGWTLEDRRVENLIEKIRTAGTPLEDYVMGQIERGTLQIKDNPFIVDAAARTRFIRKDWRSKKLFRPILRPADIQRYRPKKPDRFLISGENLREIKRCRAVWKYLQPVMNQAPEPVEGKPEQAVTAGEPVVHELPPAQPPLLPVPVQKTSQLIFAPVQEHPAFSYDPKGSNVISKILWKVPCRDPMLAAVLNSKLGQFFLTLTCPRTGRGYHITPEKLGRFPVYTPDFDKLVDTNRHDRMVVLVSRMLDLQKRLRDAQPDDQKAAAQKEIEVTDGRIDALVYELYGLTAGEIAVVEEILR